MKYELTGLKKQMISSKVESFTSDSEITALFEDDLEIKELQAFADELYKKANGIRGVFSETQNGFSFATPRLLFFCTISSLAIRTRGNVIHATANIIATNVSAVIGA